MKFASASEFPIELSGLNNLSRLHDYSRVLLQLENILYTWLVEFVASCVVATFGWNKVNMKVGELS